MIWDFFEADPLHASHSVKSVLDDLSDSILAAKVHLVGEGTVLNVPPRNLRCQTIRLTCFTQTPLTMTKYLIPT